jgi:hypothetical protein
MNKIYVSGRSFTLYYANIPVLVFKDTLCTTSVSKIPLVTPILIQLYKLAKLDTPFIILQMNSSYLPTEKHQKGYNRYPQKTTNEVQLEIII